MESSRRLSTEEEKERESQGLQGIEEGGPSLRSGAWNGGGDSIEWMGLGEGASPCFLRARGVPGPGTEDKKAGGRIGGSEIVNDRNVQLWLVGATVGRDQMHRWRLTGTRKRLHKEGDEALCRLLCGLACIR